MLIDANELPQNSEKHYDICVVGAGAAGITAALELRNSGLQVCLLESGDFDFDTETQALYAGENIGYPYYDLDILRLRYFGGTTNHWAGACRPLEELDFLSREAVQGSGWPFSRAVMDRHYRRAHEVLQFDSDDYDLNSWLSHPMGPLPLRPDKATSALMQINPVRFGQTYRSELVEARSIDLVLNCNAVHIQASDNGQHVEHVDARTLDGKSMRFTAARYVIALGAIENARILLSSRDVHQQGLGNSEDLVGRYFMEHLSVPSAAFVPSNPALDLDCYQQFSVNGSYAQAFLAAPSTLIEQSEILNIRCFVSPGSVDARVAKSLPGVQAAGMIWNELKAGQISGKLADHVATIARDIDDVIINSYQRSFQPPIEAYTLVSHVEQAPDPDSRVMLSEAVDELGVNRVELNWRFGELEARTVNVFMKSIAEAVGEAGLGRLRVLGTEAELPEGVRGAWHQMGTTRMHSDPRQGVVDEHGRVHGLSNLYMAGASVFPTCGYTNPTLTIVALATRLAEHLVTELR